MDAGLFETQLKADGYTEIETKSYEPRPVNGEHGHHFSVRGLVLDGAFIVTQESRPVSYGPGQVFNVTAGEMHCEEVGPAGTRILVGRKY